MHPHGRRWGATGRVVPVLLSSAALLASGCTLLGLGFGAIGDARNKKQLEPAPTWRVLKLNQGTRIALHLSDGQRIEGAFVRTDFRDPASYAAAFEDARAARNRGVDLPQLGPCVLKEMKESREQDVHWVGIDLTGIVVGKDARRIVPFQRVGALRDEAGRVVSGLVLQELVEARQVPLLSAIWLKDVSRPVLAESVVQLEVAKPQNGKLVGALTGFVVDAILIAVVASAEDDSPPPCTETGGSQPCTSCPFALSFDGARYVRDAEVLGLATLESAQQTDRAALDHLAAIDGEYRLRIANELREIDAIDAVRLLVADAPKGARVVPTADGRLFALTEPVAPRRVRDLRGRDVTRLLERADGSPWVGSPWGRSPDRDEDLRDGMVIEFDRPSGADSVTLAFRLRSTPWAVQLLTEALALHGPDLPAWRARMNDDAPARRAFFAALRREVLPSVSIWDGLRWRPVGVLTNLGPWLDREQALRVSLEGIPGLRVRLDATPGLWIVDSTEADFARPSPVDVLAVPALRAERLGRDVRQALADADGRREVLDQGDVIELAFVAPPPHGGRSRRVFLEATGYYTPLVPAGRDARPDLFEELVDRPGAVARWSLGRLAEEAALAREGIE